KIISADGSVRISYGRLRLLSGRDEPATNSHRGTDRMRASIVLVVGFCAIAASGCTKSAAPASPTLGAGTLTPPTAAAPTDLAQLTSLRPTLSVGNSPATAGGTGTRSYEFQVSDKSDFSTTSSPGSFPVLARQTGVPEGSGTTSYTPDFDLQPATRLFWRARV